jgi:nucleotide-binding universal stress UspA family protein
VSGRIVVGIDGSPQSETALEWALERAALDGSELQLVNAFSFPEDVNFHGYHGIAAPPPVDWFQEFSEDLLATAKTWVHEVAPELRCTVTSVLGSAGQVLAATAEGASAIVVGRRGFGPAKSALLGSVSLRLTTRARCPVIVTGDNEPPRSGPIVVGVDGSDFGAAALKFALQEAALRNTTVRAVTAYRTPELAVPVKPEFSKELQESTEAEAAEITSRTLPYSRAAQTQQVEVEQVTAEGRPADVILEHAADAQLIVVGSHGKGMIRRLILGSVSRQVLLDSERPVAVIDITQPADDLGTR